MTLRSHCILAVVLALVIPVLALTDVLAKSKPHAQTFNVRDYGARGNGKIDDTRAIRAAIDAASSVRGTVVFPGGQYLFSDELLVNGVSLQGQPGATLVSDNEFAYIKLVGAGGGVYDLTFELSFSIIGKPIPLNVVIVQANNCGVARNVFKLGTAPLLRHFCILVQNAASSSINNNNVGSPGGVSLQNAKNVSVTGNTISASPLTTIPSEYSYIGVISDGGTSNAISGNTITGASTNRLDGNSAGVIIENKDTGTVVKNNVITNFAAAVVVKNSSNCRLEHNQMNCSRSQFIPGGIDLSNSTGLTVVANSLSHVSTDGIRGVSIGGGLTILQNDIKDCGLDSDLGGSSVIFVDSDNATIQIQKNTYSGNTSQLNYFIECKQPSPPAVVSGNQTSTMLPNRIGP